MRTKIERVTLAGRAPGQVSFQLWLAEWRALQLAGWDVAVLRSVDGTHAIGLAVLPA